MVICSFCKKGKITRLENGNLFCPVCKKIFILEDNIKPKKTGFWEATKEILMQPIIISTDDKPPIHLHQHKYIVKKKKEPKLIDIKKNEIQDKD